MKNDAKPLKKGKTRWIFPFLNIFFFLIDVFERVFFYIYLKEVFQKYFSEMPFLDTQLSDFLNPQQILGIAFLFPVLGAQYKHLLYSNLKAT